MNTDYIDKYIEEKYSEKRRKHTYGVRDTAMKLAVKYGADPEKARVCALYHDMFRRASDEMIDEYIEKYGLDPKYRGDPDLAHGKIAAIYMNKEMGIDDEDMLNAVSYHTTGRAGMSTLEKVITTAEDGVQTLSGFYNPAMWQHAQLVIGLISAIFACCAIAALWRKDRPKYYGLGKVERIKFKDYADVLAHNRGIQMLVLAASSDKLAMSATGNSSVVMALYGIIFGSFALNASVSAITGVPVAIFGILGIGYVARKMGQKQCLLVGTWGSMITAGLLTLLICFGHNTGMKLPSFQLTNLASWGNLFNGASWSLIGVLFIVLYIAMKGFSQLSGNIVIPMTADCADYEVYRTGRYVPGLMGTLFSFVDKLISSLASTFVALVYAAIGFKDHLPTEETPYSTPILIATLICFIGMPMIGWILNVVAMKFYPLNKEKMEEIQDEIARIKAESQAQKA